MKLNKIQLLALSGVLGSVLMYSGDMLLYYEPISGLDYNSAARMSSMPINRLIAGGLIGPVASVFSIIGSYLLYLIFRSENKILAKILFVSFSFMFLIGGTYHAIFPNFGFVGRLPESLNTQQIVYIRSYLKTIYSLIFVFGTIWTVVLFYLVIFKKSVYPKWMLFFTPTLLILLATYLKDLIPFPLGVIIYGGWINLCYMLFFTVCLIYFNRKRIKPEWTEMVK